MRTPTTRLGLLALLSALLLNLALTFPTVAAATTPAASKTSQPMVAAETLLPTAASTAGDCDPATDSNCVCIAGDCRVVVPVEPEPEPGRPAPPPGTDPPPGGGGGGGDMPEPPPDVDPGDWGRQYSLCAGLFTPGTTEFNECLYGPAPAPGGPPPPAPPTQAEILQLVAELSLPEPGIGSAPCTGPGCMGAVGLPVWLWTDPWSTHTDAASIRGYTLLLTANPTHVDWSMGDGTTQRCTTAGTPYQVSYGIVESPSCGHIYEITSANQPGQAYSLTATMTWAVTWTGAAAGSTTTTTTQTVPVRIGEYQTVITYND